MGSTAEQRRCSPRWAAVAAIGFVIMVGACSGPKPEPVAQPSSLPQPVMRPIEQVVDGSFAFQGAVTQGGLAIGQAPPRTVEVMLDGQPLRLDPHGRFMIGFGRDAADSALVEAQLEDGTRVRERLRVVPRTFQIESIPSLHQSSAPDPEYERIRSAELAKINAARASSVAVEHWSERFIWPAQGRISGVYGSQRILGGVPRNPHSGVDVAAPRGTQVVAPAGGMVALAEPGFSLEGNLIILDHGYGLFSSFLHLSRIDVKPGDRVVQGQPIGAIGTTGRSTGPHLHWAMTWNGVKVDPQLMVGPMPAPVAAVTADGAARR